MPSLPIVTRSNSLLGIATAFDGSHFAQVGSGTHRVGMGSHRFAGGTAHLIGCVNGAVAKCPLDSLAVGAAETCFERGLPAELRTSLGVSELTNNISCAWTAVPRVLFLLWEASSP